MSHGTRPTRVQRKRTKGYRLPDNTVSVTRPGKWGNPFFVSSEMYANRDYFEVIGPGIDGWRNKSFGTKSEAAKHAVALYRDWLEQKIRSGEIDPSELRDKNLACFCAIGSPCHGDVLLEKANPVARTRHCPTSPNNSECC